MRPVPVPASSRCSIGVAAKMADDGGFDVFFRRVQGADASPFRGVGFEIGGGFRGPRLAHSRQPRQVGLMRPAPPACESAAPNAAPLPFVGGAVENPASFLEPLDQAGAA